MFTSTTLFLVEVSTRMGFRYVPFIPSFINSFIYFMSTTVTVGFLPIWEIPTEQCMHFTLTNVCEARRSLAPVVQTPSVSLCLMWEMLPLSSCNSISASSPMPEYPVLINPTKNHLCSFPVSNQRRRVCQCVTMVEHEAATPGRRDATWTPVFQYLIRTAVTGMPGCLGWGRNNSERQKQVQSIIHALHTQFPRTPILVLAPGSEQARPSAQPPINVYGNFLPHVQNHL